ncbi:ALP1-like protein isoform X1 [Tanacetum coccineum]
MKCTTAIRQLAYGTTPDAFDEYLQMSERTARECLWFFNMCIITLCMAEYLRKPTLEDVGKIYTQHETRHGFSGMLVCTGNREIVLLHGRDNTGRGAKKYLADGIYLQWTTFVKYFTVANDAKHAYFKRRQEGARKDVERAFGVLQGRWGIIQQPARAYEVNTIRRIMYSCIIMHNMILKDQKMRVFDWNDNYANPSRNMQRTWVERCETQRRKNKEIRDRETHQSLQRNLMEHIWQQVEHEDEDF